MSESRFHWVCDSNFDFVLALVLIIQIVDSSVLQAFRKASFLTAQIGRKARGGMTHATESFYEESCSSISVIGEKGRGGRCDLNGGFHGFTPKRPHELGRGTV